MPTKAKPVLYSFRRCPYAMRARLALYVSGLEWDHREIVLRDKPAHMLEISPKGTVPVLQLADGTVLEESLDIMRWALARSDPQEWLSGTDAALIAANDGPFKHHLDRYKYSARYDDADPADHRAACLDHLSELEARLSAAPFLCGQQMRFTDAAIAPFVRQFANTNRDWFAAQALPHVQTWLTAFVDSGLFALVMTKHDLWQAEPPA